MVQATPGIIPGIDPIFPRPEVTDRMAFAPGIRIGSEMDLVYMSGITAYPPDVDPWNPGSFSLPGDAESLSRMATDNLDAVLKAAGITWQHIVQIVRYTAPGGGAIDFNQRMGDWRPCSTSLRVTDTGVPGVNVVYQITAVAPRRTQTTGGPVNGIEPILPRPGVALRDMRLAPAIRVGGDMDLIYFSGITAYPADIDPWNPGSFRLPEDIGTQEQMVVDSIDRMLTAAGITWQHVILIARTGEAGSSHEMRNRMGDWRPCRTDRVVGTGVPGAKVIYEITAAAARRA